MCSLKNGGPAFYQVVKGILLYLNQPSPQNLKAGQKINENSFFAVNLELISSQKVLNENPIHQRYLQTFIHLSYPFFNGCKPEQKDSTPAPTEAKNVPKATKGTELEANGAFFRSAAAYFERHQRPSGRREYIINPEGTSSDNGVYNVVRHAGAL